MKRIYFIKPIGMDGPIKIGCSCGPERRRSALATWSPFALEIVAELPGDFGLERRFHAQFADSHERKEWFTWTPRLGQTIDEINAGTFDIASLPDPQFLPKRAACLKRTPVQSLDQSYNLRMLHMGRRSGFGHPFGWSCRVVRDGLTEQADAYLAAPHIHGLPLTSDWAREKQRLWLARAQA